MASKTTQRVLFRLSLLLAPALIAGIALLGCRVQEKKTAKPSGRLEQIKAAGKIVVGTSADYPPFEFRLLPELESDIVGIDIDIAEAIAANLNVQLEIRDIVFSQLFDELAAGRIDLALAGLSPTEKRRQTVDFSIPYFHTMQNMLIRAEDRERIRMPEDLRGKKVGAQKGSIQEDMARDAIAGAEFIVHEQIPELVAALRARQLDAVILEKPVADSYVTADLLNLECSADNQLLQSAAAVRKGDHELLQRVNAVLEELIRENQITESLQAAKVLADKI